MSSRLERQLDELLASTSEIAVNQIIGNAKVKVSDITHDSSKATDGVIFCCIVGENVDGHNFAKVAVANGAVAILVERRVDVDVTQIVVSDVRSAMGYLAAELFNRPSEKLNVIGVNFCQPVGRNQGCAQRVGSGGGARHGVLRIGERGRLDVDEERFVLSTPVLRIRNQRPRYEDLYQSGRDVFISGV